MSFAFGRVKSRNLKKNSLDPTPSFTECRLCSQYICNNQIKLNCLNPNCQLECHITCLADLFVAPGEYIPVEGTCPYCVTKLKWGDLIRKMRGCNMNIENAENCGMESIVVGDEINDDNEDDKECYESVDGESSDDSHDVTSVLERANEKRPSWLFEDI